MSLAVTDDQQELARVAGRWAQDRQLRALSRGILEGKPVDLAQGWQEMAEMGWTGLLVPEELGGAGAERSEAVVLLEQLAGELSPYPVASTLAATAVLVDLREGLPNEQRQVVDALLTGVADGSIRLGVSARAGAPVLGGAAATHVFLVDAEGDLRVHRVEDCDTSSPRLLDPAAGAIVVGEARDALVVLVGAGDRLLTAVRLVAAAEAVGVARASLDIAVAYAGTRQAFGRVIGSFQAIKHHCANMLMAAQTASASTWRAAGTAGEHERALVEGAAYLAGKAVLTCTKTTIQVLGGIGYTWEHDAHLYLRRAGVLRSILGPLEELASDAGRSCVERRRPRPTLDLPEEGAAATREEVRGFVATLEGLDPAATHAAVVDAGYLYPHWPAPWGRDAAPLDQLVIDEELRGIDRVSALGKTYWEVPIILPTILQWGTSEQVDTWMRPSMLGELGWCQLFSEPGAGSDLAALRTRAVKVEGGWRVTGQKVWTSDAHHADVGMALVRTSDEGEKHAGITCMVVDLRAAGVEIRPLAQITGEAHFNEVFLDDVFVPDKDVLGPVGAGWKVGRTTLGHERVSLGAASSIWTSGPVWKQTVALVGERAVARPDLLRQLGELVIAEEGAAALHLRSISRALSGQDNGIDGSVSKTVVADLAQAVGDFSLEVLGDDASFFDGPLIGQAAMFLAVRMATIAGGTSEILRNVLAEQGLGLPREQALN